MSENIKSTSNRAGYDRWADFYDSYPNPTVAMDERYFPDSWKHLSDKDILEIGCGTGRHTSKLLMQNNRVTGIDISRGMLEVARKHLLNVKLIEGDFMSYENFSAQSFDAVVTSLVIEHIEDVSTFFKRVDYVLREKGQCFLSEIHPIKAASGGRAYFKDPQTVEKTYLTSHPHSEEVIEQAASRAGFQCLVKKDLKGEEFLGEINDEWKKYLGQPMVKIWGFYKN